MNLETCHLTEELSTDDPFQLCKFSDRGPVIHHTDQTNHLLPEIQHSTLASSGMFWVQIRYKDLAKLGVLAFKGLSMKAEPMSPEGVKLLAEAVASFSSWSQGIREGQRQPGEQGSLCIPCCILFIYFL